MRQIGIPDNRDPSAGRIVLHLDGQDIPLEIDIPVNDLLFRF